VLYAGMYCDHGRSAGRTGLGAVMGSKNLKAIAVRGSKKPPLAEPERYAVIRSQANRDLKEDNQAQVLHDLGTSGVADYSEYIGAMPIKYYHRGSFPDVDKISGSTMAETILVGKSACHGCVIACGRVVELEAGKRQKGPEYETVEIFGPNLLHANLIAVTHLGDLCDRYGFDTISAGNTIGLAFHLFEKGIIKEKDVDGLTLNWGDGVVIEKLVHKIGKREGIGELLGKGSREFGRHFGAEEEAVQVNGLEVACHDPRGASGMALTYATSPRGACHNQSDYFFVDWGHNEPALGIETFDRHGGKEKSANVAIHQNWRTVNNALVMCVLAVVPPETTLELVNAACGWTLTLPELMASGERGWNLKRAINIRLGLTGANDRLPKALLEPVPDGNSSGYVPDFPAMLESYYEARGWDPKSGKPSPERLNVLGMTEISRDLWG
jgi:aldehyde:ferredoxin oxidoreductase